MTGVFELLQMHKYRLLYFIWFRGKVKDEPGLKAKLARLFGYKSDGHFYVDWDFLFENGFLVSEGGYIVATDKAQKQFSFLTLIKIMQWLSLVIAVALILFITASDLHWNPPLLVLDSNLVIAVSAGFLIATAYVSHRVYNNFVPAIPSKEELRDSMA